MDRIERLTTDLVLDALKQTGIKVVKVTDEQARQFVSIDEYRNRAQFSMGIPIFHSNAALALAGIRQGKATASQWLGMLSKAGGIKAAEDRWTGLSTWLREQGNQTLTHDQVSRYITANTLQIREEHFIDFDSAEERLTARLQAEFDEMVAEGEEVTESIYTADHYRYAMERMTERYGEDFEYGFIEIEGVLCITNSDDAARVLGLKHIDSDRLSYSTEDLYDKKEIALYMPDIEPWNVQDTVHFGEVGDGRCIAWIRFGTYKQVHRFSPEQRKAIIDAMPKVTEWKRQETGGHYNQVSWQPPFKADKYPDMRIWEHNDRFRIMGVKDMLHVTFLTLEDAVNAYNRHIAPHEKVEKALVIDEIQSKRLQEARKVGFRKESPADVSEVQRLNESSDESRIPETPFLANWHELCMKRMLRYAAENGFDKLHWTTGEIQNRRYDMTEYVQEIDMKHTADDGRKVRLMTNYGDYWLDMAADGTLLEPIYIGNVKGKCLKDFVGKELAGRILAMEDGERLEAEDLAVGGEGMKAFYDRILPQFMNHYGKKWGVQTRQDYLFLDGMEQTFHTIDVTPAMKQSVLQGQPMFMRDTKGKIYGWALDDTIYLTRKGLNAETAIHEYTHLWANAMRLNDRPAWKHVKSLLRDTPIWNEVKKDPNYRHIRGNDDELAGETLARISGRDGAAKLEQAVRQVADRDTAVRTIAQVKQALGKFWSWVGRHILHIRQARTITDVTDRILGDLLRGYSPQQMQSVSANEEEPHQRSFKR